MVLLLVTMMMGAAAAALNILGLRIARMMSILLSLGSRGLSNSAASDNSVVDIDLLAILIVFRDVIGTAISG